MSNNKKEIKYLEKKRRLELMISEVKIPLAYTTKQVLFSELISVYDTQLPLFNQFLEEVERSTDSYVMNKALTYSIRQIKMREWKSSGFIEITDRFYYFKTTLLNNIERVKKNEGIT